MSVGDEPDSYSSHNFDITRVQQWIDNSQWDVLDTNSSNHSDIEICARALATGILLPLRPDAASDSFHEDAHQPQEEAPFGPTTANCRFQNPQLLGLGGYGVVFAVDDIVLGIPVAIKFLRPSHNSNREYRGRFLSEAKMAASLNHPAIIRIYDVGRIDDLLFITSACVRAGSLAKKIACSSSPVLQTPQAVWMVHELANAVSYAHSVGMLHRDLKPANVLLEPCSTSESEGLGFRPILTDFGLAKRIAERPEETRWTIQGQPLGTTRYMSPEQASGESCLVSSATDIYSLGVILYELVVGTTPFQGSNQQSILRAISDGRFIRPRLIRPGISSDLEAVILRAMARDTSNRYQTMPDFQRDLQRLLCGKPVEAKKSTLIRRTLYWIRQHPLATAVAAATAAVNVCALAGLWIAVRESNQALEVERQAKEQVQIALDNEQRAFQQLTEATERRKEVLKDVVLLYAEVTDDIIAGKKVNPTDLLPSLSKTATALQVFLRENPQDAASLHRLNVIQHYMSIAYHRSGNIEKSLELRQAAIETIEKLLVIAPTNVNYHFDRYMSYLTLGELQVDQAFNNSSSMDIAIASLQTALVEVEAICQQQPDNLGALEGRLATKQALANACQEFDPEKMYSLMAEVIDEATQLSLQFPARESFHGMATLSGMRLATNYYVKGDYVQAHIVGRRAMELFDKTRRPIPDETSRLSHAMGCLVPWRIILKKGDRKEESLAVAKECTDIIERLIKDGMPPIYKAYALEAHVFQWQLAKELDKQQEAQALFEKLNQFLSSCAEDPQAKALLIDYLRTIELDAEITSSLEGLLNR